MRYLGPVFAAALSTLPLGGAALAAATETGRNILWTDNRVLGLFRMRWTRNN